MSTLEVDVEIDAVDWVENELPLRALLPKFVSPGRNGAPDRLLIISGLPTVFVEFKRPGRKHVFQKGQPKWRRKLRALHQRYWIVDDLDDFKQRVHRYIEENQPCVT